MTIDLVRARCRGEMAEALRLLKQRYIAYPRSNVAPTHYASSLQFSNQPRAAREILRRMDPERDLGWWNSPEEVWPRYWWRMAATWHMVGGYRAELDITDRWRDSSNTQWQLVRGRALSALGREREVMDLLRSTTQGSADLVAVPQLTIADELAAHGHAATAMAVAESILVRLELLPPTDWEREQNIAWANRLLGRPMQEREALERVVRSDADTLARLEARGRIAVLLADTAQADRIDAILARESNRPLRNPQVRGQQILARAYIAAGFGRREQAVALLRDVSARGLLELGPSHAFHADPLLLPCEAIRPSTRLLIPDN